MKILRFIVVLVVIGYAGWLAWPYLAPLLDGGAPNAAVARMEVDAQSGGELFGFLPTWVLWVAAISLYLVAALMLGAGNPRAAAAYFLAFIADAALRLVLDGQGGAVSARSGGSISMALPTRVISGQEV
jgi:hypothetical protein